MTHTLHTTLAATTAFALLTSCAVGPDFKAPAAPDVARYTDTDLPAKTSGVDAAGGAEQTFAGDKEIPADWWKLYGSEPLNALMEQALKANPDLKAANASLKQAHETYLASISGLLPAVDATFSPTREKFNPSAFGENGVPSSVFTLYNASVTISYTLDVFGGTRREIEEQKALANYQKFERDAAFITLTANVVTAAVQEASLSAQIRETNNIIDIESKQLGVLKTQFDVGATAKSNVLQQQATLAQTQATLPPLEKQLAQARNQLAVLAGAFPGATQATAFDLNTLHLPEELPVSLPSKLVAQRPDIRAAEEQLHAASAGIGVATANMLPQFTISASGGYESVKWSNLFSPGNQVWSLGGSILQPLFHGGELFHERKAAVAAYDKAAAQYQSTVLGAFKNVADTLRALQYDADGLVAQVNAEHAAKDSLDLVQAQFNDGAITYPQLLDAQRTYQQSRINLVQAQAQRYADTAALYQALGGSWHDPATLAAAPAASPTPAPAPTPAAAAAATDAPAAAVPPAGSAAAPGTPSASPAPLPAPAAATPDTAAVPSATDTTTPPPTKSEKQP